MKVEEIVAVALNTGILTTDQISQITHLVHANACDRLDLKTLDALFYALQEQTVVLQNPNSDGSDALSCLTVETDGTGAVGKNHQ